jgi:uncharacterized HAD superfamily protein
MNLGFDIDGVISDFATTLAKVIKNRYGLQLTEKEFCNHNLSCLLGISKEERSRLVKEILLQDLELIKGAKEALLKLHSEGHKIFILTARYKELENVTRDWLERKGIPYSHLIILNEGEKHLADVQLDLVVEDNLDDAIGWSKKVKNVLVLDHPWNRSFNVKRLFKRVYNWDDILNEVEYLASERND